MNEVIRIGQVSASQGTKVSGSFLVAERPAHPIELPLSIINGSRDGPVVLITAGTHATEYVGFGLTCKHTHIWIGNDV
tara:strand:+ start:313 stop:546 length:234 start_codon:yes stop_codon:yes gene_type:complete